MRGLQILAAVLLLPPLMLEQTWAAVPAPQLQELYRTLLVLLNVWEWG